MNEVAIDTNILVYLYNVSDETKRSISEELLTLTPVVGAQVISESEYLNVTRRLLNLPKADILTRCAKVFAQCTIVPTRQTTLDLALKVLRRYDFQLFDSLIVAAALESGCTKLYTEDMQHGLLVENRLRILNPFL